VFAADGNLIMTRRSKLWRVAAVLFAVINVAGAGVAAAQGEALHAAVHAVLLLLLVPAYLVWRPASRPWRRELPRAEGINDRLEYLQQSVDAIALEVERIGEAQRFSEKLRAERPGTSPQSQDGSES
jgi:hypothetical protein